MRAIVVGAGIGGLTASIALRAAGIDAVVFDQTPEVGATMVGGGFHLWPNAVRALSEIDLAETARTLGASIEVTEFHSELTVDTMLSHTDDIVDAMARSLVPKSGVKMSR